MPRSISRSPPRKGRHRSARSPSPGVHRHSRKRRRESHRSRSPGHHGHSRHRSRSPTPRRSKRRSDTRSPIKSRSPSILSLERKRALEKVREDEDLEKRRCLSAAKLVCSSRITKRRHKVPLCRLCGRATNIWRQTEAEAKIIAEETAKRVEEAIRKNVHEALHSEEVKKEIELKIQEGRKKIFDDIAAQLEREKEDALAEARRKEEEKRREKEELEKMLEENRKKIEDAQRWAAEEQARKEEERYRELEALQRQKEEALRRKKLEEEQGRAEQMKILGKKNTRPKLSFALGSK